MNMETIAEKEKHLRCGAGLKVYQHLCHHFCRPLWHQDLHPLNVQSMEMDVSKSMDAQAQPSLLSGELNVPHLLQAALHPCITAFFLSE